MPIYDNPVSGVATNIAQIYDRAASGANTKISFVYDNDGTTNRKIFGTTASTEQTLSTSGLQGVTDMSYQNVIYPGSNRQIIFTNIIPGQSYGTTTTKVLLYRGGSYTTIYEIKMVYGGGGFSRTNVVYHGFPYTFNCQNGDQIILKITTKYDPNVSGAQTTTAIMRYKWVA